MGGPIRHAFQDQGTVTFASLCVTGYYSLNACEE